MIVVGVRCDESMFVLCSRSDLLMVIGHAKRACVRDSGCDAEQPHQEDLGGPAAKTTTIAKHGWSLRRTQAFSCVQNRVESVVGI